MNPRVKSSVSSSVSPVETGIDAVGALDPARAIDRGLADIFDPLEQRLAAVEADHVAEQPPEEADVGIVRDAHDSHRPLLHRNRKRVNKESAPVPPWPDHAILK